MKPNRGKKRLPYGGYDIEIVEVDPKKLWTPPSPEKLREFAERPKVPLIPTKEEIGALPRWARVALAARCARRVLSAFSFFWANAHKHYRCAVEKAVCVAEQTAHDAINAAPRDDVIPCTVRDAARDAGSKVASDVANVAEAAHETAHDAGVTIAIVAATTAAAAHILFETATIDTPLTAQLRCIRRDFARLKRLTREHKWTDDTPVPPDVFGPMWPDGVAPYWFTEPPAEKPT